MKLDLRTALVHGGAVGIRSAEVSRVKTETGNQAEH